MTTPFLPTGSLPYGLQWPAKGSPRPTVRSSDPIEGVIVKVQGYINTSPLSAEYLNLLQTIVADLNSAYLEVNPDALKQPERLLLLNTAYAKGEAGISDLLTYVFDEPSHPEDTTALGAWMAVQVGYVPPVPIETTAEKPVRVMNVAGWVVAGAAVVGLIGTLFATSRTYESRLTVCEASDKSHNERFEWIEAAIEAMQEVRDNVNTILGILDRRRESR